MSTLLEPDKDLHHVLGEDQIDADDDKMEDVLNGMYDEEMADDIELVMDADSDKADEEDIPDNEALIARSIVSQCEGIDDDGMPKVTIGIAIDQVNPYEQTKKTVAQTAFCKPVLKVNIVQEFIELRFDFKTAVDRDLRVMWSHLEKYGELCTAMTEKSQETPFMTIVMAPFSAVGTCYMTALNPIMWNLQPPKPGDECTQIKVLLHADNLEFYETDEISLENIEAQAQRIINSRQESYESALEAEEAKAAAVARSNQILENLRQNGV